ncbi:hypothetical protein CUC43_14480 [Bacillus thuringiensis LM1212]|uniref:hypothetical protein n=1 Tax=Bacillus TaxID=1386 RepID=UPI00040A76A0|nr:MULTISPECIES: hypothetical protein [Bacillus cereus group]PFE28627.1 hypothetical protein CN279_05290 [Bacillus anthracis]AXY07959.1 hypothetical protein CUC43_14480 [Bacillus thuringiensis LM1212]MBG9841455.1 hypothetical protein [Bacillus tropicus]MBG9880194.1 hypothetical protein [Bacillus tropicus]MBG9923238.1 hypothetical protein [Bacillus tropicus]
MYKQLPHGVKIGITRSIVVSFEKYMKDIEWNEENFDMQQFVEQWKQYLYTKSTWIDKVDDELKGHPDFHQALAMKVNEKINEFINEKSSEEQIEQLKRNKVKHADEMCKLAAEYHIERLLVTK